MRRCTICTGVLGLAILATTGCQPERMTLPAGFVRLEEPGWHHVDRAVSPDGVYVGVRDARPADGGDRDFWTRALRNHFTGTRGYTLVEDGEIKSADGTPGKRLDFAVTADQRDMRYTVALWVHADRLTIAEAGGPKDAFETAADQIDAALASVTVK